MDAIINSTLANVAEFLEANSQMLAAARFCTGGWLTKVHTALLGSYVWFDRGFVTYAMT